MICKFQNTFILFYLILIKNQVCLGKQSIQSLFYTWKNWGSSVDSSVTCPKLQYLLFPNDLSMPQFASLFKLTHTTLLCSFLAYSLNLVSVWAHI